MSIKDPMTQLEATCLIYPSMEGSTFKPSYLKLLNIAACCTIMYGKRFCAHAALRLQHPPRKTLFWDPAGEYGNDGSVFTERNRDIILENPPSLNEYIFFRTEITTTAAEFFEWQIPVHKADALYDSLANGTDESHPEGKFTTQGAGFFCSYHVSDFLERFVNDIIAVKNGILPTQPGKPTL
ncbi:MAG: hypothetical protein GY799_30690 [Desulfobulbaceae bacterium]|nr:hypothetical protein [Desulfobulbaceae bacterium]